MEFLVWIGAAMALAGLGLLVHCILAGARLRKAALPEDEARARIQSLLALNFGALALSALGLMMVVVALLLG